MGDPVSLSLGVRTNPSRNQQAGNAQLINCFSENQGDDSKNAWLIYGTEGLTAFGAPLGDGPIRAGLEVDGTGYVVSGRSIYVVSAGGSSTLIGGLPTDGPVYMERNRKIPPQIAVVSDNLLFVIDSGTNSVTQVLDPDLPAVVSVSFLDGYGIYPVVQGKWYISAIDDFTSIDALDFATAEAFPDETVRSMVLERELILLGTASLEFWTDTGDADFPFSRVHATELGCLAPDSVVKVDTPTRKTVLWVAPDHTVRQMNGYGGDVVSTNEIESLIRKLHVYGNIAELKGTSWSHSGRFFYTLSCSAWTRTLDSKTGHWHSRESYELARWKVGTVFSFANKIIAGDYQSGQLYVLDPDVYSEDGQHLVAQVITPPVSAFPHSATFNAIYIDAATGIGLNTPDDPHSFEPEIMVSWSDDGGFNYGTERRRSLGELAQTYRRVPPIYRLGRTGQKGRTFKLKISAPVPRLLISMAADYDIDAA